MKRFHRNLNFMSIFTAALLAFVLIFRHTFLNIAITNIVLNGIIIGVTIFGIGLCFFDMFRLLPEYKWMHTYFNGNVESKFSPRILLPVALTLRNKHAHLNTSELTKLLDLVEFRIENHRESVRYITNVLIFLGLLGTFWGLILTIGGFAQLLTNVNFNDESVLQEMQNGLSGPLTGMATAFTSSLLGLAGSLVIGFLGLQLQLAQNTVFQELTDFMSKYIVQKPGNARTVELSEKAPVNEATYTKISEMYDAFLHYGYEISDLIRIDGKYPAVVAIGSDEKLYIGTLADDPDILQNVLKRLDLCFADTLEGIHINTHILSVTDSDADFADRILTFSSVDGVRKYLSTHKNVRPTQKPEKDNFNAYAEYISTALRYLFK